MQTILPVTLAIASVVLVAVCIRDLWTATSNDNNELEDFSDLKLTSDDQRFSKIGTPRG